jgi:hypothetical protein
MKLFILIILLILFLIFGPIFTIWSLNCLFSLTIPINLKTFFSIYWILLIIGNNHFSNKSE